MKLIALQVSTLIANFYDYQFACYMTQTMNYWYISVYCNAIIIFKITISVTKWAVYISFYTDILPHWTLTEFNVNGTQTCGLQRW